MNPGFERSVDSPNLVNRVAVAVAVRFRLANIVGVLSLIALFEFVFSASAAEEADVDWKEVRVVSTPYEETGTVAFDAKIDGRSYKAVTIDVFGKQFTLSETELSKLQGFPLKSLHITRSPSYPEIGGYTVYFALKRVHYTLGKLLEDRISICVSKGKGLEIRERGTRELQQSSSSATR